MTAVQPSGQVAGREELAALAEDIGAYMLGAYTEVMVGERESEGWEKPASQEAAEQFLAPLVERVRADERERVAKAIENADRRTIDLRVSGTDAKPHIVDMALTYAASIARTPADPEAGGDRG